MPEDLDPDEAEGKPEFEEAIGFRLRYYLGAIQLVASYVNHVREEDFLVERACEERVIEEELEVVQRENILGLVAFLSENKYALNGEFTHRFCEKRRVNPEWGPFLQGVAPLPLPLTRNLFAIGRYELFNPTGSVPDAQLWTRGTAFRPFPPIILKAE